MKNLIESLIFHRENYAFRKRFDDKLPLVFTQLLVVLVFLVSLTGLSLLAGAFVKKWLKTKNYNRSKITSFVFSKNHLIVYNELYKLGIQTPYIDFTFSKSKHTDPRRLVIPTYILVCSAFANGKRFLEAITENKGDVIQKRNRVKLLKLAGYEFIFSLLLKDMEVVIKFNDHIYNAVMLYEKCIENQVKTVYVQHATVTHLLPALHHDLNVLFSLDSIEKYELKGINKEVFEFVDVRLLVSKNYANLNVPDDSNILIAINGLDDLEKLKELINHLNNQYNIFLRTHPRDKRSFALFENMKNVKVTEGTTIWEDMNNCATVICNQTGVPLEAIYYNRLVYKAAFLSDPRDSYAFVENRFITREFNDIQSLVQAIAKKEICFDKEKLAYYIGDIANYQLLAKELKTKIEALV